MLKCRMDPAEGSEALNDCSSSPLMEKKMLISYFLCSELVLTHEQRNIRLMITCFLQIRKQVIKKCINNYESKLLQLVETEMCCCIVPPISMLVKTGRCLTGTFLQVSELVKVSEQSPINVRFFLLLVSYIRVTSDDSSWRLKVKKLPIFTGITHKL